MKPEIGAHIAAIACVCACDLMVSGACFEDIAIEVSVGCTSVQDGDCGSTVGIRDIVIDSNPLEMQLKLKVEIIFVIFLTKELLIALYVW